MPYIRRLTAPFYDVKILKNVFLASIKEEIKSGVPEMMNTFPLNSIVLNKPVAHSFSEISAHSWPQTTAAQTVGRERYVFYVLRPFP